jgi:hypothetical protein
MLCASDCVQGDIQAMVNMQIEVEVSEERASKLGKRGPA